MGLNPRRRRRRHGRRHHRKHYRRNPAGSMVGQLSGAAPAVLWGVVGAAGSEVVPAFAARWIPLPSSTVARYAIKVGAAVGVAYAVRRFVGRAQGNAALIGGLLNVALDPVKSLLLPMVGVVSLPGNVSAYLPSGMGAYLPDGHSPLGYLNPGSTVGDYSDEGTDRLDPDSRF